MKRYFFGKEPRAVATFVCHIVNGTDQRARELLEHELTRSSFDRRDRDLTTELVYGTLRRRGTLDQVVGQFVRRPLANVQPRVLEILRLGAYQLLFLDKVPASAAVNEAARIAGRVGSRGTVGFVNGCLRALSRAIVAKGPTAGEDPRRALPRGDGEFCVLSRAVLPDPERSLASYLAAAWSHPEWLVRRWLGRYGEATTRRLCEQGNAHPGVVLRVNHLRTTRDGLAAELRRTGRWPTPVGPDHLMLDRAGDLGDLRAVADGLCTVQGVAASMAAVWLAPRPGERVLDVCAAPGSKACQLAELAGGQATVVALDVSQRRIRQVAENGRRLGARTLLPVVGDGCACERLFAEPFDAVLVDVPCSNTGVLARRVECRWRLSPERIAEVAALQRRLLAAAAPVVRPGGRLVYSTCSLEPDENEQAVESFCRDHPQFQVAQAENILPPDTGDDGGYLALMRRADQE